MGAVGFLQFPEKKDFFADFWDDYIIKLIQVSLSKKEVTQVLNKKKEGKEINALKDMRKVQNNEKLQE